MVWMDGRENQAESRYDISRTQTAVPVRQVCDTWLGSRWLLLAVQHSSSWDFVGCGSRNHCSKPWVCVHDSEQTSVNRHEYEHELLVTLFVWRK